MPTNDFLPFCPTDTGTNLLTQSAYAAAADRTIGNQPGVASSALVNKSVRQPTYIMSQFAQYISNTLTSDVLDDATPAKLLSQIVSTFGFFNPVVSRYTSGSGTHTLTFIFQIASGSATAGATYTNNTFTYTVSTTVASGVQLIAKGTGVPTVSGTLTKATGSGDASLTFYAVRMPSKVVVEMVGAGGGGSGGGTTGASAGSAGGNTTFGSALLTANGGSGGPVFGGIGTNGSLGGTFTVAAPAIDLGSKNGQPTVNAGSANSMPPPGAAGPLGSGGNGGTSAGGPGGGGGGGGGSSPSAAPGSGGAGGAYVYALLESPSASYAYAIGAAGALGTAGTSGNAGFAGGAGLIVVREEYQ